MKRKIKILTFAVTMLSMAYVPLAQAAPHRGVKVQSELTAHKERIQEELIDQLIDLILEKKILHLPKRSGSGTMELVNSQELLTASYEEKAAVIHHLPQELRETIFNKLAEQLMRGPKKSPRGPFKKISCANHISQLDTFLLLAALLCDDNEQKYVSLRDTVLDCLGETQILKLKTKLGKPHVQNLLPSDFKRDFLTSDPFKLAQLVLRLQPLMEVK